ncbi:MAG TPA: hypothetical protein VHF90_05115 [Thermoleophilaceae bacterium]|nr:hypothetical protein [Thermoleophilaceae bacterium]
MRARRHLSIVAGIAVLAMGGVSCDSGDGDVEAPRADTRSTPAPGISPARQIQAAYSAFVQALYSRDFPAACGRLTPAARRSVGGGGDCAGGFEALFGDISSDAPRPRLGDLKVSGATARGVARSSADPQPQVVRFTKDGDTWRIGTIGR